MRGRSLFFIAMLAWVGCVADAPEVASWFGDDIAFRADSYQAELAGLPGFAFWSGTPARAAPPCAGSDWPRP